MALGIDGLVGLGDDVFILFVCRHIADFVGDAARLLIHNAVRRLDKAVFVDARIRGKRADQADVGAFRRLDGAHSAVVRMVNVAHFEAGSVAVEAARAKGGKTALMRQLGQRVGLVHELGELGGAEELLDGRRNRADIDERRRRRMLEILNGHALSDDSLQTREADAQLVLQQLAHRADAAVAQMVDIVRLAQAKAQAQHIAEGGEHVFHHDVLGNEGVVRGNQARFELLLAQVLLQNLFEGRVVDLLIELGQQRIEGQVCRGIHKVVADDGYRLLAHGQLDAVDAGVLNLARHFRGNARPSRR